MLLLSYKPSPPPYSLQLLRNPVCPGLSHNTLRFRQGSFPSDYSVSSSLRSLSSLSVGCPSPGTPSRWVMCEGRAIWELLDCRWLCFAAGLFSCGAFRGWWIGRSYGICRDLS